MNDLSLKPPAEIQATGIEFNSETSVEEFQKVWTFLIRAHDAFRLALGDAVAFAESQLKFSLDEMSLASGIDCGRLREYATVAKRIPLSRRSAKLRYEHHQAIAAQTTDKAEQLELLQYCEKNQPKASELRQMLRVKAGDQNALLSDNPGERFMPFPAIDRTADFIKRQKTEFWKDPTIKRDWLKRLKPLVEFYSDLERY